MTPYEFGRFVKQAIGPELPNTHTELSYKPGKTLGGRAQLLSPATANAQSAARTSAVVPNYRKPESGNIWAEGQRGATGSIITKPHGGRTQTYPKLNADGLFDVVDPSKEPRPSTVDT